MKIQFLGTAAAEGIPAFFCQCDVCKHALINGGRNIRSRSQALIDDKILIEFGPDSYFHMLQYKVPLDMIHHILVTHDHDDHFYMEDLQYRGKWFASKIDEGVLNVYAGSSIFNKLSQYIEDKDLKDYVCSNLAIPFKTFKIEDYEILPLRANHAQYSDPLIYVIKQNNKSILYAHDTGYFCKQTWEALEALDKPLDLITIDCTGALKSNWRDNHLSLDIVVEIISEMKEKNIINDSTIVIVNHFSHNGLATYDALCKETKKHNIIVSYDGMIVEF